MRLIYLLIPIFFVANISFSTGQDNLVFKKLPERLELSKMAVRSVLQDSHGFLWFGTIDGLVRYDGYDNKIYRNNPYDSTSIAENQIKWITEDEMGYLWFVNTNGTLNKFDPLTEKFQTINFSYNHKVNPKILAKIVFHEAFLWLLMLDGSVYQTTRNVQQLNKPISKGVVDLKVINNRLWLSTDHGLRYWAETQGKLGIPLFEAQSAIFLEEQGTGQLTNDQDGNIWVATKNAIHQINAKTQKVKSFQGKQIFPFLEPPFTQYKIIADETNRLWIWKSVYNVSLSAFDIKTKAVKRFIPNSTSGLTDGLIRTCFLDNQGHFWAGTNKGPHYVNTKKNPFQILNQDPSNKSSISGNHVTKIIEDKNGLIWIGTNSGGLNCYDSKANTNKIYTAEINANSIISNAVNVLFEDSKDFLWIGSDDKGLSKLNLNTGIFTHYQHQSNDSSSLSNNNIRSIYEDLSGNIWVGTHVGLNLYQAESDNFISFVPIERGRDISIMSMLVDKDNQFWLTTYGSGLYQFNRQSKKFKNYKKEKNNPRSLSHNNALALWEDKKGRLWISTSEGLNLYHPTTDDFSKFTTTNGFKNDQIFGMVEDGRGRLWLSTTNGLTRFNPDNLAVRNYTTSDGLPSNRFTYFGYGKSRKTDKLFFGSLDGLAIFHPDSLDKDSIFYPIVLSKFDIYHNEKDMGQAIEIPGIDYKTEIALNYLENTFTIDFATLEFNKSENIQYTYQLAPVQQNWVNIENNSSLTFSNLNPGQYKLHLKSTNSAGIWNPDERELLIKITPPWWQRKIAYFIYAFLLLIATYLLYRLLLNRKITQTRFEQLSELDAFKTQFYTNITHEFRTPLTIISGMAEKLKQEPQKWKESGVEMIRRNSYNLLRLVTSTLSD